MSSVWGGIGRNFAITSAILAIIPIVAAVGANVFYSAMYLGRTEADFNRTKEDVADLKKSISDIQTRSNNLQGRIDDLTKDFTYFRNEISKNESSRSSNKGDMAIVKTDPSLQKSEPTVSTQVADLPIGTIAAFNLRACPKNWRSFDKAEGRFLMGAPSNKNDNIPTEGASLFDMINTTDVPSIFTRQDSRIPLFQHESPGQVITRNGRASVAFYPPYVQVKFCERV